MGFILTIHVLVCIFLIAMILLQVGRGASTGASFGGDECTRLVETRFRRNFRK